MSNIKCKNFFINNRKFLVGILVILVIFPFLIGSIIYAEIYENKKEAIIESVNTTIATSNREFLDLKREFSSVAQMLSHEVSSAMQPNLTESVRFLLEKNWFDFIKTQKYIDHIRLLNITGDELIRVNNDAAGSYITAIKNLETFKKYQFFDSMQQLDDHEIETIIFDLERNQFDFVYPYNIAYRVITPVEAIQKRVGYIVVNLNSKYVIENIFLKYLDKDFTADILTKDGFYIFNPNIEKNFGHQLKERSVHNLTNENSTLWQQIKNSPKKGFLTTNNTTYVWGEIIYSSKLEDTGAFFMLEIENDHIHQAVKKDLPNIIFIVLFLWAFIALLFFAIVRNMFRKQLIELNSEIAKAAMNGMAAVVVTNASNQIIDVNPAFSEITGYSKDEVIGKNPKLLNSGKQSVEFYQEMWGTLLKTGNWEGEIYNKNKAGEIYPEYLSINLIRDSKGDIKYHISTFIDISAQKNFEATLKELSERDHLTKLYNKRVMNSQLEHYSELVQRYPETKCSLAIIDIDFFKKVNDTYGHNYGDEVLVFLATSVVERLRKSDIVGRYGGEEFLIILPKTDIIKAKMVLNKLREFFEKDTKYSITISIGVTELSPTNYGKDAFIKADEALYAAKNAGRNMVKSS